MHRGNGGDIVECGETTRETAHFNSAIQLFRMTRKALTTLNIM